MNSACAVVANKAMGAAPYLIQSGENGILYRNKQEEELWKQLQVLMQQHHYRENLGRKAYDTIVSVWNSEIAATRLFNCIQAELAGEKIPRFENGPLSRI